MKVLLVVFLLFATVGARSAEDRPGERKPAGLRFAIIGEKPPAPAPVLFIFALDCRTTLSLDAYALVGAILREKGVLLDSLDLPCHGEDIREGEPEQLKGWRARADKGIDFVAEFTPKASSVLDHLVKEGYADPARVAACGTSRGGFMALRFAAAGFSPVTDLTALSEFSGIADRKLVDSLRLTAAWLGRYLFPVDESAGK